MLVEIFVLVQSSQTYDIFYFLRGTHVINLIVVSSVRRKINNIEPENIRILFIFTTVRAFYLLGTCDVYFVYSSPNLIVLYQDFRQKMRPSVGQLNVILFTVYM